MVPGHHAGSERRGRHCAPALVVFTKASRAVVAGIHCPAPRDERCAKIPLKTCRSSPQHVAAALNVVETREVAIWHLSGSVLSQDEFSIPSPIEGDYACGYVEHVAAKRECLSTCTGPLTAMARVGCLRTPTEADPRATERGGARARDEGLRPR